MFEIRHLSASSISLFLLCPHAWRERYVNKVETPTSPAAAVGSAAHAVIEAYLRAKTAGQSTDLGAEWEHAWSLQCERPIQWGAELPEQHSNDGARLFHAPAVRQLLESLQPLVRDGQPVLEHRVELHVPEVPVPVIGYADFVGTDLVPGDFKTASRAWSAGKADAEIQPLIYLAALNQMGWKLPTLAFRHYVLTKGRTVSVQKVETIYRPAQVFAVVETVQQVWRGIQAGCFPYNTSGWKHDSKWCDYWIRCPMGGKR